MQYYIRAQGKIYGPYESSVMLGFVKEKRVLPNTEVSTDKENWTFAGKIPELFPPTSTSNVPRSSASAPPEDDPYGLKPLNTDPYGMGPLPSDVSYASGGALSPAAQAAAQAAAQKEEEEKPKDPAYTDWDSLLSEPDPQTINPVNTNPYAPPPAPRGNSSRTRAPSQGSYGSQQRGSGNTGAATTALILGILMMFFWCCPLLGFIVGGVGLKYANDGMDSSARGCAVAGKILCSIGIALSAINAILGVLIRVGVIGAE